MSRTTVFGSFLALAVSLGLGAETPSAAANLRRKCRDSSKQRRSRLRTRPSIQGWRTLPLPSYSKTSAAKLRNRSLRALLCLALASPVPLLSAHAVAQRGHRPTIDDRVKVLARSLDLNEAQQAAVKKILEQRQQETLRIRQDASISGGARIERFRALQDRTVERIRAVLNEEQKKKYDPLAVRRVAPAPDQRSVEDWLKVTTPQ